MPQLAALTGMRGLAAWFVVLFHTRVTLGDTLPEWLLRLAAKGYLAVDLFFILSGFVLWHTYGDRLRGAGWAGAGRFWWRRIARIWPLHAVVLSGFVMLALVLAMTGRDTAMYPWAELPFHYLLVQNWGFTTVLSWNDPAWSISCEMGAYVVFPAVVAIAPWGQMRTDVLVAAGALLLGAIWFYFAVQGSRMLGSDIPRLGLARCLLEFWLGNVLRLLWGRWRRIPNIVTGAGAALITLLAGGLVLHLPETSFIPGCFAALIFVLSLDTGILARVLGGRVLNYLGEISYSTYLVHYLLFALFKLVFIHGKPALGAGQLAGFMGIVFVASVVLYHGVEKPAQGWLNGLAARRARGGVVKG